MIRRFIAFFLSINYLTLLPAYAMDMDELYAYETDEELRLAIMGDEKWVQNYPAGLFNFIGGKLIVNEGQAFLDFAVVRQGGTQGDVSVDFKVIDVTAKYGEDYVVEILKGGSQVKPLKG